MGFARILWPLVTLLVVITAAFIYFVYPPMCSGNGHHPQPVGPVAEEASHNSAPTGTDSSDQSPHQHRLPWEADYRLPATVRPLAYRVLLHPDLTTGLFSGSVIARIAVSAPVDFVALHVNGLDVSRTVLYASDGARLPLQRVVHYKPNQFWVVVPASPLTPGTYSLHIQFAGNMMQNIVGLYMSTYLNPDGEYRTLLRRRGEHD